MKKIVLLLTIGMLLFSGALFAQTTQGANTNTASNQEESDYFAGGGYVGPVLGSITIAGLRDAKPNEFVIVEGYLIQQRVPGTFILADAAKNHLDSVVVRVNPYIWSNLQIKADTPVLIYGIVNRSELRIEIEVTRIEIQ